MSATLTSDRSAAVTVSPANAALRWYLRIGGVLLILFPLSVPIIGHPAFRALIGDRAPLMAVGLVAIAGSFGTRVNRLMGALLAVLWVILSAGTFYGSDGASLPFEILNILLALGGIVIVLLSYRAGKDT